MMSFPARFLLNLVGILISVALILTKQSSFGFIPTRGFRNLAEEPT
jgi:hypothetical protein